ncbi:MAG: PAS domain S-box protein [Thermoanaerobaculia bacterium]
MNAKDEPDRLSEEIAELRRQLAVLRQQLDEQSESEQRWRLLFQELESPMLLILGDGTIVDANPAAAKEMNSTREALAGTNLVDFCIDDSREVLRQKFEAAERRGESSRGAVRFRSVTGRVFPFGFRAHPVIFGGVPHILVNGRDVSAIEDRSERYALLFERSLEPIAILERHTGKILDCNPAFERLTGRTHEELIEMTTPDLRPAEQRQPARRKLENLSSMEPEQVEEYETVIERPNGERVELAVRLGSHRFGSTDALIAFLRDTTRQKSAEERYRRIFELGAEPHIVCDKASGKVVEVNPAFAGMIGRPRLNLVGLRFADIVESGNDELLDRICEEAATSSRQVTLVAASGERIPADVRASILEKSGEPMFLVSFRDLRPEVFTRQLERSLAQAQKLQALGQMASGIAHDFNNTLMAALPWADLLRRKYPEEPAIQNATDHIRRAVHRARDVTRQLLDFAQPRKPEKRIFELGELIDYQLKLIRPAIPPGIEVVVQHPQPLSIEADPAQVGQLLLNLAINARDAMPKGGVLRLGSRVAGAAEIARWGLPGGEYVVLELRDTGIGIDSKAIQSIFDPFFTTKELGKGVGLGLSVVHRIAEQHGARVFVESAPGEGTTFAVAFPRASAGPAPGRDVETSAAESMKGVQILIVDDETEVTSGMKSLLEIEGASVRVVDRGRKAIALLDSGFRPDMIILDLGMPEMSGDVAHGEIRRRLPSIPILISSGFGESSRFDPLLRDGRTRYRQKPYEAGDLFEEIRIALASSNGMKGERES